MARDTSAEAVAERFLEKHSSEAEPLWVDSDSGEVSGRVTVQQTAQLVRQVRSENGRAVKRTLAHAVEALDGLAENEKDLEQAMIMRGAASIVEGIVLRLQRCGRHRRPRAGQKGTS